MPSAFQGTTILMVRHNGEIAVCGDGQVSLQGMVLKNTARKVRRLYHDKIICGVAGATADAFAIMEKFESHLSEHSGHLLRSAVELAKSWRGDRVMRRMDAMMLTCDAKSMLLISGNGDLVEPDDNVLAIGSGGFYALAAARALLRHAGALSAGEIARESLTIASEICVYTNNNLILETLAAPE